MYVPEQNEGILSSSIQSFLLIPIVMFFICTPTIIGRQNGVKNRYTLYPLIYLNKGEKNGTQSV
jgi:hypothetical protein